MRHAEGWNDCTGMRPLIDGYCHRCGKFLGPVEWSAADFVFCKPCAKAEDVYTPPKGT